MDRERLKIENEIARERKERENELRQMREQNERVQMEKDREIAELRNQLSRASLAPQVNTFHVFIHSSSSSSSSSSFHSVCVIRSILLDFWSFKVKTGRVDVTNARIS